MALQETCGLHVDHTQKELQAHGTPDFPCAGFDEQHTDWPDDIIPWHWHEEMEMIYVKTGKLKIQIPEKSYILSEGDCIVINSNILHYVIADPAYRLNSIVFSPSLITGTDDSVFARKYMLPLTSCTSFDGWLLRNDNHNHQDPIHAFISAFDALACDAAGFEFIVRENLTKICLYLYQQFEHCIKKGEAGCNRDEIRIKKMMDFIHENFSSNLTLADIARAADIGERECLRCFKKTILTSPIQYLMKYRIMQSAMMLLENPASSVSEIALSCGFDSPSNFSKLFKRFYSCTPKEYRKNI